MKKLTSIFIASLFIFSSCGKIVEDIVIVEKKPFLIETQILSKKTESYTIDKSARITAGSSLTLSAESAGEVVFLSAKE